METVPNVAREITLAPTFLSILMPVYLYWQKPSSGDVSSGYTPPPPLVVKVESAFRPLKPPSTLIFSMKNRDGSRTHQTISYDKGYENVTEIMLAADGKVLAKMSRRGK